MDLTLTPAYGRDYQSAEAAQADWEANKDFKIASIGPHCGRYINKPDAVNNGIVRVGIRYAKLTKKTIVQVGEAR